MKLLIYKEDGLGDSLFCIPLLKFFNNLNENNLNKESIRISFYSKYISFLQLLFKNELNNIEFIDKKGVYSNFFDVVIFLGPISRFFNDILFVKSKKKYSIIYKNKFLTNLVLKFFTITILFEDINSVLNHEIFNIFNLVFYIFQKENLVNNQDINLNNSELRTTLINFYSIDRFNYFKQRIDNLFLENFRNKYSINGGYIILHITYKSFKNGISFKDYYDLINQFLKLDKIIFLVFGPLELIYLKEFQKIKHNRLFILTNLDLVEYVSLCYKSDLFIGFDTGTCHLAAFSNAKKIISLYPDKIFHYNSIRYSPINNVSKIINLPYSSLKDIINFIIE
ncbi:MAG: hypothetical protein ACP5O4_00270 [bacterium]